LTDIAGEIDTLESLIISTSSSASKQSTILNLNNLKAPKLKFTGGGASGIHRINFGNPKNFSSDLFKDGTFTAP
jgi:hypothetical protein